MVVRSFLNLGPSFSLNLVRIFSRRSLSGPRFSQFFVRVFIFRSVLFLNLVRTIPIFLSVFSPISILPKNKNTDTARKVRTESVRTFPQVFPKVAKKAGSHSEPGGFKT